MKRGRSNIDQVRYPMFVTSTITDFIRVFANPEIATTALHIFEEQRRFFDISVYAYALMPSHFHTIVRASRSEGTSQFMGAWKSPTARMILERASHEWKSSFAEAARRYQEPTRKTHKVWMTRFDDVAIYSEDVYATKLNYIHENPARAGIVKQSLEYAYSSALACSTGEPDRFVILTDMTSGIERPPTFVTAKTVGVPVGQSQVPVSPWADRAFGLGEKRGQPKG